MYVASFMDNEVELYNKLVENYVTQIIKKNSLNLNKNLSNNNKFWIICYDPSNSYEFCLKKNKLNNNSSKKIKSYQTVAIFVNNNREN